MLQGFFQARKECSNRQTDEGGGCTEVSSCGAPPVPPVLAPSKLRFDFSRHTVDPEVSPPGAEVAAASRLSTGARTPRRSPVEALRINRASQSAGGALERGRPPRGGPAAPPRGGMTLGVHAGKRRRDETTGATPHEAPACPVLRHQSIPGYAAESRPSAPSAPSSALPRPGVLHPVGPACLPSSTGAGGLQQAPTTSLSGLSREDQDYLLSAAFLEDFGASPGLSRRQLPEGRVEAPGGTTGPLQGGMEVMKLTDASWLEPLPASDEKENKGGGGVGLHGVQPLDALVASAASQVYIQPWQPQPHGGPAKHQHDVRAQQAATAAAREVMQVGRGGAHSGGNHPSSAPVAASSTTSAGDPALRPATQASSTQCKEFLYRGGGRGGAPGNGRGRGGLGYWGRPRGGKKAYYLSLSGEKRVGNEAYQLSKQDAQAVQQGQTFTCRRADITAACRKKAEELEGGSSSQLSSSPVDVKASLGFQGWGLEEEVVRSYEERGVRRLFDWQVQCLESGEGRVLRGGNLVYSAPTSGGKTMVAELLMLRALTMREEGTALFVVPFIALAEEKASYFRRMWGALKLGVKCFHSEAGDASLTPDVHVAVCTIERANSLVNHLLELGELRRLSIVVVDELHMIGDQHRGYLIEVMLSKLRLASSMQQQQQIDQGNNGNLIQIVGLSATLPNLPELARWLDADLFVTSFRPVSLSHHLLVDDTLWRLDTESEQGGWSKARQLPPLLPGPSSRNKEMARLIQLCQETVGGGDGAIVFCNSRKHTQICAEQISHGLLPRADRQPARQGLMDKLRDCPVGLQPELEPLLAKGVAYHHAGMTMEERGLLEEGFRAGAVSVLVATSTLAAGVNLPARRVIIRHHFQGRQEMDLAQFKQMCGRAGRFGLDSTGEAILMSSADPKKHAASRAFMERQLPPMRSVLREAAGEGGVTRAVLEVIAGRMACGPTWLQDFMRCTLLAQQVSVEELERDFKRALAFLLEQRFIMRGASRPPAAALPSTWQSEDMASMEVDDDAHEEQAVSLEITQLGMATFFSAMAPRDAQLALQDMAAARAGLVLTSDLHLLFFSVPGGRHYFSPPYEYLCRTCGSWGTGVRDVAERVGLTPERLERARRQAQDRQRGVAGSEDELVVRFANAVALHEQLQEVPLVKLDSRAEDRGTMQRLRSDASMYCGMLVCFCRKLKWETLATLFSALQERLAHGAPEELLPLVRLGSHIMHMRRARALFDAGYTEPHSLAQAEHADVARVLKSAGPFTTESSRAAQQSSWWMSDGRAEAIARRIVQRCREHVRTASSSETPAIMMQPQQQQHEGDGMEEEEEEGGGAGLKEG